MLVSIFVQACSLGEEEPPESNETEERSIVPRGYVLLDAQAILLEGMILEEGHDEIISNVGDDSQKAREEILGLEVISIEGEECHVETDISQWNLETSWMARVEPKINDVIHVNEVTWCDSSVRGRVHGELFHLLLGRLFDARRISGKYGRIYRLWIWITYSSGGAEMISARMNG